MRTEVAIARLVSASQDKKASPETVAKALSLVTRRVTEVSPVGARALDILKKDLLKDALTKQVKVLKAEAKAPAKKAVARKAVASKRAKTAGTKARPKGRGRPAKKAA